MERKVGLLFLLVANLAFFGCQPVQETSTRKTTSPQGDVVDLAIFDRLETNYKKTADQLKSTFENFLAEAKKEGIVAIIKKQKENRSKVLPNHQKKLELDTGIYFLSSERVSWHIASQKCRQAGMELASIETEQENKAIAKAALGASNIWSSGSDLGSEGTYYWSSTGRAFNGSLANWQTAGPNTSVGKQHCVYFYQDAAIPDRLSWGDYQCDYAFVFMCELKD